MAGKLVIDRKIEMKNELGKFYKRGGWISKVVEWELCFTTADVILPPGWHPIPRMPSGG